MSRAKILAALLVVAIAGAAVMVVVLANGNDEQTRVEVQRGAAMPDLTALNRADDYGADVMRAYLQSALSCTSAGEHLMTRVSRSTERTMKRVVLAACARSGGRPLADRLEAEIAQEDLDHRGRSLWRVTAHGGSMPDDLVVRLRQSSDGWEIDRPCTATCPT